MTWEVRCGDARKELHKIRTGSVHLIATSPPFWKMRTYGHAEQLGQEATPEAYVENLVEVFREARRVLHDTGSVWLEIGDCYARNGGTDKRPPDKAKVRSTRNTLEAAGSRDQRVPNGVKEKDLLGIPWMLAFALRADGWHLRNEAPWIKFNGSPASVTDRLTVTHEHLFLLAKSPDYFYDVHGARMPSVMRPQRRSVKKATSIAHANMPPNTWSGAPARDVPLRDGGDTRQRRTTDAWREALNEQIAYLTRIRDEGGMLVDDEGHVGGVLCATAQTKIKHFATYPEKLVEPLIRLSTSEHGCCSTCGAPYERVVERQDGTVITMDWRRTCDCTSRRIVPALVLDPFNGSGTTGVVATMFGRNYLGIDLNPDYCDMTRRRIQEALEKSATQDIHKLSSTQPVQEIAP